MREFNYKDFDIDIETEVSKDGQVYGNWVNWDYFRIVSEDQLLEYYDIYLP